MTRYLFYSFNEQNGAINFNYIDENGNRSTHKYMGYSLRKALQVFRWRNNLDYKHIKVQKLDCGVAYA